MTIEEHDRRCRCTHTEPCDALAEILREQHAGGLFQITDPGRFPGEVPA